MTYKRRVRRILPAAVLCLALTVVVSYLIYRTARFESVLSDAIWSLLFTSNWHFAETGTDYLQAAGPVSPLQHFWSLSVEEQFYIVWPILLIAVFGLTGRRLRVRGRSAIGILAAVIAAGVAASFVWAMIETTNSPTWAYFSTFSRGWELATGALLAVGATALARIPAALRPVLSYAGLAAIIASFFVIGSESAFPGPWAALPVAGAALVIGADIDEQPRFAWPLTNRASVYVGTISYSLYLWHFPVINLLAAVVPNDALSYDLIAVAVMLAFSIGSFHLVEDRVLRSSWLEPGGDRKHGPRQIVPRPSNTHCSPWGSF